jgi:serine/threonine protein kinase/Flp pilus assembly protein TadD
MEDTARTFTTGDRISNYEILGLAGIGGMGVVYKALDNKLERQVALKFLPPHLTFSEKDRKRLLQEAKAASALDHPNIGVIHGIDDTPDGQAFIVMAFYEGTNLSQHIKSGPLALLEAVDIACQAASGLAEAHRHHIIHRDIKPSNILITRQGLVKIVDFGLALVLTDLDSTRSLDLRGTAVYMAPEQIQRVPPDQRSDIWALGVVLAEMLLGNHPFLRDSWTTTISAIVNDPPSGIDRAPQDLQAIVFQALAKDPTNRYQSCDLFLADLKRFRSRLQMVEAAPDDLTLTTPTIALKDLERYARDASDPFKTDDERKQKIRSRLLVAFSVAALLVAFWFSPLRPALWNRISGHGTQSVAYESYLSAVNLVRRYDKPGNLDRAIAELRSAVARDPQFALGHAELGEAYRLKYQQDHDSKWLDEALANCKTALSLDGSLSAVYATLGRIHHDAGNHDLALTEFHRALDLDPQNADAFNGIGYAQEAAGHIPEAETNYKKAVALRPDYWDSYNTLGSFYQRQHRPQDAIAQLKKAVDLAPDNALAYDNLAVVYLTGGTPQDLVEAEKALRKSVDLTPSYAAYANLGYLYSQQDRFADAAEMTRKALQLNGKDFLVWENLLNDYLELGQKDNALAARNQALELLEQAAQSRPRDAQVQAHLALHYGSKGMRNQAMTRVQSALALAPNDADVLANVAEAYEAMGDRKQAIQYAQLSLQNGYTLADLRRDPDMKAVLVDPEFQALTAAKSQ